MTSNGVRVIHKWGSTVSEHHSVESFHIFANEGRLRTGQSINEWQSRNSIRYIDILTINVPTRYNLNRKSVLEESRNETHYTVVTRPRLIFIDPAGP